MTSFHYSCISLHLQSTCNRRQRRRRIKKDFLQRDFKTYIICCDRSSKMIGNPCTSGPPPLGPKILSRLIFRKVNKKLTLKEIFAACSIKRPSLSQTAMTTSILKRTLSYSMARFSLTC